VAGLPRAGQTGYVSISAAWSICFARSGLRHFCLKREASRGSPFARQGFRYAALHFTPGYTPVALRAAKTRLIHTLLARMGVGYAPGVERFAQPLA